MDYSRLGAVNPGPCPISANVFRVFFVKTPTESSSRLPRLAVGEAVTFLDCASPSTKAGCPIQARFWLEWDTTALDAPFFVIPSVAERSAVCPGSRTKVSVPLVLPQNRHPERSASQIDRVTQSLWRGVEGPRRRLIAHAALSFSTTGPARFFPGIENQDLASILLSPAPTPTFSGAIKRLVVRKEAQPRKAPSSMGKISTAEVLRLRATSAVSRDQSVRRSAQDDDSVGGGRKTP
jgi:hypothetical protein